jgi:hypothetical protein
MKFLLFVAYFTVVSGICVSSQSSLGLKKTFITDKCLRDSDCVSGCCGFRSGLCAGPVVAIERDGACGFGNSISNCNAAKILGFRNVSACRNLRV